MILDTTAISDFFRGNRDVLPLIEASDELYVSPVVIGEMLAGFMRGDREKENRRLLDSFLTESQAVVLAIDEDTGERYAHIHNSLREAGMPIPTNDIWIAAQAMQHGLRVVAGDSHYSRISQIIHESYEP